MGRDEEAIAAPESSASGKSPRAAATRSPSTAVPEAASKSSRPRAEPTSSGA